MRRSVLIAAMVTAAWCAGFVAATVTVHAYTKLGAWQSFGERFQLGYVAGYIDAVKLSKFHDMRVTISARGRVDHKEWLRRIKVFYDDPANAARPIPDAMLEVGRQFQAEVMKAYKEQRERNSQSAGATPGRAPK